MPSENLLALFQECHPCVAFNCLVFVATVIYENVCSSLSTLYYCWASVTR